MVIAGKIIPQKPSDLKYIDHLSFIVISHVETPIWTMWKLISRVSNWKKCGKVKPFQSSERYLVCKKKFGGKWTQNWRNFIRGTFIHQKTYVSFRACFFSARFFWWMKMGSSANRNDFMEEFHPNHILLRPCNIGTSPRFLFSEPWCEQKNKILKPSKTYLSHSIHAEW